ncbi:MAG: hypothetical protein O7D91_17230 [Planctomycetota bacterium]|nr:hypothetical protein [Planctomycetota bacterium]
MALIKPQVHRLREIILFVVVWLVCVFVLEVIFELIGVIVGWLACGVTVAIHVYARHHAAKISPENAAFKFWLFAPTAICFVLPIIWKIWKSTETATWWDHVVDLTPITCKVVVPGFALLWVYYVLGRIIREIRPPE